jgi:predicted enzyme related to lactoylglutathione lyase
MAAMPAIRTSGVYCLVMANIDKHPAGSFCWIELATSDQNAAKSFYSSLFGWVVTDNPMGPDDFYTIFKIDGRDAAAGYTLRKEQRAQGVSPHWMVYVAVDSADQAAAKAAKAGGTVLAPAFDVVDVGRMAVVQDPTGAVLAVWQAKSHSGTGIGHVNGTLCWADLSTPDPARAGKFYSDLFGWKLEKGDKDPSGYLHIKNGEHFIGGIPAAVHRPPNAPAHWMIYFQVGDVAAATAKATKLGAKILMPPQDMEGVGTWSIIGDPQGAVFAIFKSAR